MAKKKSTVQSRQKNKNKTVKKQVQKASITSKPADKVSISPQFPQVSSVQTKENRTSKTPFVIFIILSLIGIFVSIYLVYEHYAPVTAGSGCDFSENISCTLVNNSIYSEIFNVPVSLFGVIWFVVLILMSWLAFSKPDKYALPILTWNLIGLLSVIYLIIIEFILGAICPYCTVVHIIIIISLITSFVVVKKQKTPVSVRTMIKTTKGWLIGSAAVIILFMVIFNISFGEKENYDALAQCITAKHINMYSSFRCGFCAKTRAMFDDSFQYINEIECHPQGKNAQVERCLAKKVDITPTWIQEENGQELKRQAGFMTIQELRDFSGCNV